MVLLLKYDANINKPNINEDTLLIIIYKSIILLIT